MSKSQNTKSEQQKDLCITSEQLTEQWQKGELPDGVYYCNTGNTIETLFTWGKNYHQLTNNKDEVYIPEMDDCEILAPVPSYEEWVAAYECQLMESELVTTLKKLLKECSPYVNSRLIETRERLNKPYTVTDKVLHKKAEKLLTKIDEALK